MSETRMAGTVDVAGLLDGARFSRRQFVIVLFCGLFLMVDGYDAMQLAYVAPKLLRQWDLGPAMLGTIFSASGISSIFFTILLGPLADRWGRRPMLIMGAIVMGVASLGGAYSGSFNEFFAWRMLAGLGIGIVMPIAIALGAEYAPARSRSFTVTAFYCGYALGASIGAGLAARIIPAYGWPMVFIVGTILPIAVALVSMPLIPESIRFLVLHERGREQIIRELRRINPAWSFGPDTVFKTTDLPTKSPMRDLFREGRGVMTVLIWVVYFTSLYEIYFLSSWIPTLAQRAGVELHLALNAVMVLQIGAIIGGLVTGLGIDRWRAAALAPAYLIGVLAVGTFGAVLEMGASVLLFVAAFFVGAGVMGAQNGTNGLTAKLYPTAMRSTGVSMALAVARVGSVIGPAIGGAVVSYGFSITTIFVLAAVAPLLALLAVLGLWFNDRRLGRGRGVVATGGEATA